ncbi:hypothetical protein AQY21_20595 [Paracoccus sp. MKU1]|nr:hypothetical protein AQY21_20595 [Paracoccus sp. MKU1]
MIARDRIGAVIAQSPRIASLPRDRRGLPIPYVVFRDDAGNPDFIVNDIRRVLECLSKGLCGVCGQGMDRDDVWMIGGPGSALDPRGMYNDGPVHHECGAASLRMCPYLAIRRHKGMKPVAKQSVLSKMVEDGKALGFVDPTMDPNKPESFILGRVDGLAAVGSQHDFRLIPNRPFIEIEEWAGGTVIQQARLGQVGMDAIMEAYRLDGERRMKSRGETIFNLAPFQLLAWSGGLSGEFPWT